MIVKGDFSFEAGVGEAAQHLLSGNDWPDAIFAASDDAAAGVLSYAYTHHIKVPGKLAVLGFDNSHVAQIVTPALTTVKQPFSEMGRLAVQKIMAHDLAKDVTVPYEILTRDSV